MLSGLPFYPLSPLARPRAASKEAVKETALHTAFAQLPRSDFRRLLGIERMTGADRLSKVDRDWEDAWGAILGGEKNEFHVQFETADHDNAV